jgi:hypothetical protein
MNKIIIGKKMREDYEFCAKAMIESIAERQKYFNHHSSDVVAFNHDFMEAGTDSLLNALIRLLLPEGFMNDKDYSIRCFADSTIYIKWTEWNDPHLVDVYFEELVESIDRYKKEVYKNGEGTLLLLDNYMEQL